MTPCSRPWESGWPPPISRSRSSTSTPSRMPTRPSSSDSTSINTDVATELLEAWADQPAIDHHCHPLRRWPFQLSPLELRTAFTEALDPQLAERDVVHSVAYRDAIRRIAGELECEATEDAVLAYRNGADANGYAKRLLRRTVTGTMLVDTGFAGPDTLTLPEQERATGIPQREIVRLETLAAIPTKTSPKPRRSACDRSLPNQAIAAFASRCCTATPITARLLISARCSPTSTWTCR